LAQADSAQNWVEQFHTMKKGIGLLLATLLGVAVGIVVRHDTNSTQQVGGTKQAPWMFFDFGFFDGRDSLSYLQQGMRVVAVEADPSLAAAGKANPALLPFIGTGQLQILNYAIDLDPKATVPSSTTFYLNKCTKEWNSFSSSVGCRSCTGPNTEDLTKASCTPTQVMTTPCVKVFQDHGIPVYMKADMEGAEKACYNALYAYPVAQRPNLISGEVTDSNLVADFANLGYTSFKLVLQKSGHSGGWGDQAVDCRVGAQWRSFAGANMELKKVYDKANPQPMTDGCPSYAAGTSIWYDVHASRLPATVA